MHKIDFTSVRKQDIYRLSDKFFGTSPKGQEIGFTNYYMTIDGKPFFAISGECHYSRVAVNQWENTVLKMKAGGINTVSTYVFWIHHEEIEGQFTFEDNRNLRGFVELCKKHGMYVILRIGPFCHGEVRNGGLPDWLYGKPYDVRSNNSQFLEQVRLFYRAVSKEIKGLLFKDGGPIIGAQIDNEYMHSAAPWEMTTGISNEWVNGGEDGNEYMIALKKLAVEEGIVTPFYTCTGWGGAATPTEEMLPLWGGYAFWPWMFYGNPDYKHPATPEYIYRDNHNNQVRSTYNFEPFYEPEAMPYSCCEMGGGMTSFYNYRFHFPFESVDAMANVKMAGGCNFLGYYMYRGGTNPYGYKTEFLNEHQVPKRTYDYNAAIGEFGQIRPSYKRLKCIHLFATHFAEKLCDLTTILPADSRDIEPEDKKSLRYAVRTNGTEGFLFINNYQDHLTQTDKNHEEIVINVPEGEISFSVSIAAGESAILPINLNLDGLNLKYATAQLLSRIENGNEITYFFFAPEGMKTEFAFDGDQVIYPSVGRENSFTKHAGDKEIRFVVLTRDESLAFYQFETAGGTVALLSETPITFDGSVLRIESEGEEVRRISPDSCGASRFILKVPKLNSDALDTFLRIDYSGDIGNLFDKTGRLIEDNFCDEGIWEIGLKEMEIKEGDVLTLFITPKKEDVVVDVSSTMAGRLEKVEGAHFALRKIELVDIMEKEIKYQDSFDDFVGKLAAEDIHVFNI